MISALREYSSSEISNRKTSALATISRIVTVDGENFGWSS